MLRIVTSLLLAVAAAAFMHAPGSAPATGSEDAALQAYHNMDETRVLDRAMIHAGPFDVPDYTG
ncbi:MAG TPA: hypothetical protein VHS58_16495 [Acetobacteraceae bacterium]|jgi:hypothetical protein|nr:hypothetical protein [Acetobacteraceae bacterium]